MLKQIPFELSTRPVSIPVSINITDTSFAVHLLKNVPHNLLYLMITDAHNKQRLLHFSYDNDGANYSYIFSVRILFTQILH